MELKKSSVLSIDEKQQIYSIWNLEYPKQSCFNTFEEFDKYVGNFEAPTHYLFKNRNSVQAWLTTITREEKRWLVILVHPKSQKAGLGSQLLGEMKKVESQINAWITPHNDYVKSDGSTYLTPLEFYKKNGFEVTTDTFQKDDFSGTKIQWQSPD